MSQDTTRFIGMDIHKQYVMVGGVTHDHQVVLLPRRVSTKQLAKWAAAHLLPTDRVVMEATTNVWVLHDLVAPHVAEVTVVHPFHVKVIAASLVKTDKRDTLALAKLLAAKLAPTIWIPPTYVRELRSLIVHRQHLIKQRTMAKNRLQGVIFRHNLPTPEGDPYAPSNRDWWGTQPLSAVEQLRVQQDLQTIDFLSHQLNAVDQELAQLSLSSHWAPLTPFLIQLPGIALISAMTILSAIGDIHRFETPDKLVGYAGLGARVHASGKTFQTGGITKQGRAELRSTMIEVAWTAVKVSDKWRAIYHRLSQQIGKLKAIVAVARRLLVVIWHVLTKREADRSADPHAVHRAFLHWGSQYRLARTQRLTRHAFAQLMLERVGLQIQAPGVVTA